MFVVAVVVDDDHCPVAELRKLMGSFLITLVQFLCVVLWSLFLLFVVVCCFVVDIFVVVVLLLLLLMLIVATAAERLKRM